MGNSMQCHYCSEIIYADHLDGFPKFHAYGCSKCKSTRCVKCANDKTSYSKDYLMCVNCLSTGEDEIKDSKTI
jgi:hypothetical protein